MNSPKSKSKKKSRQHPKPTEKKVLDANDSVEEISQPRRRLKRKAESSPVVVLSDSDDSEEPVVSSPVKRRRRAPDPETPQTPRSSEEQDDLDIQEDLKDLQDSGKSTDTHETIYPGELIISQLSRTLAPVAVLLNPQETKGSDIWKLSVAGALDYRKKANPRQVQRSTKKVKRKTMRMQAQLGRLNRASNRSIAMLNQSSTQTKTWTRTKMTLCWRTTPQNWVYPWKRCHSSSLDTRTNSQKNTSATLLGGWCTIDWTQHSHATTPCTKWPS